MKVKRYITAVIFTLALSFSVYGHGGRTDSKGGHYNRKTGVYHYHNGSSGYYGFAIFVIVVAVLYGVGSRNRNKKK